MASRTRSAAGDRGAAVALIARALALCTLVAAATTAQAGAASGRLCSWQQPLTAAEQDQLLSFAAVVRDELAASGQRVAIVSRSGLNLARFGIRYSHAGISLASSPNTPWSVRQLYYACAERRPRLYDQGLAGFVYGTDNAALGYLSIVLLPPDAAQSLERAALDTPRALTLLGDDYSANAHVYSTRYQNCNQWLVELLALAWGDAGSDTGARVRAQQWLAAQGYAPPPVDVGSRALMFAAGFVPWLRMDDHPADDLYAMRFRTSLPASIEHFVRAQVPSAQRIELCHAPGRVVVRRGWTPIADGCVADAGDRVVALDTMAAASPVP